MNKYLWPYRQTKTKAFFKDGKKKIVVTRTGKYEYKIDGKTNKTLAWNIGETVNQAEVKLRLVS